MKTKIVLKYLTDNGTPIDGAVEEIDFLPSIGTAIENNSIELDNSDYFVVVEVSCKKTNDSFVCEVEAMATDRNIHKRCIKEQILKMTV
jgi:hypothetical protein